MPQYRNYEFITRDFAGHSMVTTTDSGTIIDTALPFKKFIGKNIDDMVRHYRDRKSFVDMKFLGITKNGILQTTINVGLNNFGAES